MKKWYGFSQKYVDGNRSMRDLLGGKGANLAEMCSLGVLVPPGFTLPTTFCAELATQPEVAIEHIEAALRDGVAFVEQHVTQGRFGTDEHPLLFSVRSGARVSMPGMMDTVLNIGLNAKTLEALAKHSGDRRFALDSYRRLIEMFGDVVMGIDRQKLAVAMVQQKQARHVQNDTELDESDLETVIDHLLSIYQDAVGQPFPQDPWQQLKQAVLAVFGSWMSPRAKTYRRLNNFDEAWGTAANVQSMVFGNFGKGSGTGVAFSRDPSTGQQRAMGEWLPNAQGEDVVAGVRTPALLHSQAEGAADNRDRGQTLEVAMPAVYEELCQTMQRLEKHYTDMQDIEFTIQDGNLYLLQTRVGKRTAQAALKIAVDMVQEDLIDKKTALTRVAPDQLTQLLYPQLDPNAAPTLLARGMAASPGAVSGTIVLDADTAVAEAAAGKKVVLVRQETSPEDIHGMHAAVGIITSTGGSTSHAAVVARGMGRPCVVGCDALHCDLQTSEVRVNLRDGDEVILQAGDEITLDGATGALYRGVVATVEAELSGDFDILMQWADAARKLCVKVNADTPEQARQAIEYGAEGIGLCRTEHMFFGSERLLAVREMIFATDTQARSVAVAKLAPMQKQDFIEIFEAMGECPVNIRLLDPPLHEFLPKGHEETKQVAAQLGVATEVLQHKAEALHEFNPMLGHRGCRLGLSYPEIYEMQARAICEASAEVAASGVAVKPEIMVPLVIHAKELELIRARIEAVAAEVFAAAGVLVDIKIGTMIEIPRAALVADTIAEHADFFSFGTNDLTQTTLGISRDDGGSFLPAYIEQDILPQDPFASIDTHGVGRLVQMATKLGRQSNPELHIGICGEHGGDPASIHFFAACGLESISCSPFRLPVARLAAAQAAIAMQE